MVMLMEMAMEKRVMKVVYQVIEDPRAQGLQDLWVLRVFKDPKDLKVIEVYKDP